MTSFEAMVAEAKAAADRHAPLVPLARLKEVSCLVPGVISALSSLHTNDRVVTVIAEMKRSTVTSTNFNGVGDPGVLARFYAAGGAACVSVVIGPGTARGPLKDLNAVRASVDLPVPASGLVVTPYQVHEAQAHGADLLTLDARLETLMLGGLIERVRSLGMGAVIEVRTRREALTAVGAGAYIVAIDTCDPDTLAVDCSLFNQVTDVLPTQVVRIAAGGIKDLHDVMNFAHCGADVVLVGEAIIRSTDPQQFVAELVAAGVHPALIPPTHQGVL